MGDAVPQKHAHIDRGAYSDDSGSDEDQKSVEVSKMAIGKRFMSSKLTLP